ncbi:hypothetical protein F7Q92_13075 [Ideonella dechloratans]|uniref:Helix-turn-helix domain-containing protein n=1 Tax=Ideonella dechloratans TaxID=36863 RepID=A0A643FDZ0_IDEDE|nr:hypothetical protein [Ideonella dechloratans]KAB0580714.1 hypothetical protein F7Q92_13075 [Ideonella dechloratans]UFU09920.1 hypothetical protein LRM40_16735 [Ideonella dechloratans]
MTASPESMVAERKLTWDRESGAFVPAVAVERDRRVAGFIKGPLPLVWMQAAARMPGKTLQVALALWYLAGLKKTTTVRLPSKPLNEMGVSRDAKYEALARLEQQGLVSVQQQPGQAPLVTLLTASA